MKKIFMTSVLLLGGLSWAQTAPATPPAPAVPSTTLDAFLSQTGILTVRESLGTKSIPVSYGGTLSLEAVKVYTPGREAQALLGIRIGVNDGDKYSSTRYEFIELAEVDEMIKAIRYMVDAAPKLKTDFKPEMKFKSKSDVRIGLFNSIEGGFKGFAQASTETVYFLLDALTLTGDALAELKAKLK